MKKLFLSIIAVSCFSAVAQDRVKQLDSIFNAEAAAGNFNGNVLIAEKGNVIYKKSFGLRDEANKLPLDENSIFELASVSKQFTAMGIVLLQEKGKLKYDDKLASFFPELAFYGDITVRQLLNHTGGLPDYMELMEKHWDKSKMAANDDIIAQMAQYKPAALFAPGTKFEYSNTGYALLGSIIEKASGMPFGKYLEKAIFKPLQMENTFVYRRRYEPKEVKNYAYGYVFDEQGTKVLPDNVPGADMVVWLDGIVGDGMVNSTTGDLLKWDRALYSDKLASKKSLAEIFTPAILPDGSSTDYGFGWFIEKTADFGMKVSHSGGWPGYITQIERYTDNDKTIIILRNNDGERLPGNVIRRAVYGLPLVVKRQEITLSEAQMLPYVGEYELAPGYNLAVTYDQGLKVQMPGQERFEVFPESEQKFFLKVVDAQMEFVKDDKGAVSKVMLYQNGRSIPALKVK